MARMKTTQPKKKDEMKIVVPAPKQRLHSPKGGGVHRNKKHYRRKDGKSTKGE